MGIETNESCEDTYAAAMRRRESFYPSKRLSSIHPSESYPLNDHQLIGRTSFHPAAEKNLAAMNAEDEQSNDEFDVILCEQDQQLEV